MSLLLELLGESKFRVNSYSKAARSLESFAGSVDQADLAELQSIDGIGKSSASKIIQLRDEGSIAELDELRQQVPSGLLDVMQVPGVGPKTAKLAWDQLGVESLETLRLAIDDGSLETLPRMGKKSVENIKQSLNFTSKESSRLPLGIAMPIAESIVERIQTIAGVERAVFAGSLRRGRETIGDLDFLVVASDPEKVRAEFCEHEQVESVVARGETKCSVRIAIEVHTGRWRGDREQTLVGADLRIIPAESWGAALMYFTGSKDHNVRCRERAIKLGLTLNEYGLYEDDADADIPPHRRGIQAKAGVTEAEVYEGIGVSYVEPERREDAGEFVELSEPLITIDDIRAELHAHTTESDGELALEQLVQHAIDRGFHTIAVTDHSRSSVQANGLSVERLRLQREQIERARDHFGDTIDILHGSEVDIHADGSLDYEDDVLAWLDLVVASPHTALSQDPSAATERLLRAIEHPLVHVIGHPTGRLVGRRPGLSPDMSQLVKAAADSDTALEINAHWMRLDLRDIHVRAAVEAGARIAIDCDVHTSGCFSNLRHGVSTARRGWLTRSGCVNAMSRDELRNWVRSKR